MYQPITGTGNGSAPVVNLTWPFIEQDHVQARVNGAPVAATWTGASQLTFDSAVTVGTPWDVVRVTPYGDPLVSFANGAVLTEEDLNLALTQLRYAFEEARQLGMGGDAALRTDLAATSSGASGAALVGLPGGGHLADVVPTIGNSTAVAGVTAKIDDVKDSPAFPAANEGAIWAGKTYLAHALNKTFVAGDGDADSPAATFFLLANSNGSAADVTPLVTLAVGRADNANVYGGNSIARGTGKTGTKFVGWEIDVEPSVDDSSINSESGGLFINIFNKALPGAALQTGGVNGGTFANGLVLGGLSTTAAGLVIEASASADSLVNTTVGTFTTAAIKAGPGITRGILWVDGGGNPTGGRHYYNSTDQRIALPTTGNLVFRKSDDSADLIAVRDTGTGGALLIDGNQVLKGRQTGAPVDATDLASVIALANFLKAALVAHGAIS